MEVNYTKLLILLIENKKSGKFLSSSIYLLYSFMLMCQEWGDKSQFSAIALAANYGVWSIIFGGALVINLFSFNSLKAHTLCILVALVLGMFIQKAFSEQSVNLIGGILFLCFAVYELVFNIILYKG